MLDSLVKVSEEAGPLVGVEYSLFENDPRFIKNIALRFGSVSAVFRAVEADDTLMVSLGPLIPGDDETLFDATDAAPWSACVGLSIRWAWSLTNQQGYSDGARLEFGDPVKSSSSVVEMIVIASALKIFVAVPKGFEIPRSRLPEG